MRSTSPFDSRIPIDTVSSEPLDWTPRAPEMFSRAEVVRQTGAYEATITASIAGWSPRGANEDAADIEDATRQLVAFDEHPRRTLVTENPALGPMTAILLSTESTSSSQIEQLTTSAKTGPSHRASPSTCISSPSTPAAPRSTPDRFLA